MRILHLGKYWQQNGGIETHVKTLCQGLAAEGLEVVNLVSSIDFRGNEFYYQGYSVKETPTLGIYFSTSIAPSMIFDAIHLHRERPFDVIHLHFPDPMSHFASLALPAKIPRIITWHSDIVKQSNLLKFYRYFQIKEIVRSSALIAPTHSHFKSSTQIPINYPENKKNVIQFGFDFKWLLPNSKLFDKVKIIKQKIQGRNLVFALGRHVEYKGFSFLIEAINYTNSILIIGGDGPLSSSLKEQVSKLKLSDRVFFTGILSKDDVAAHYHACDIFCLPSITQNEAFGIVQIEAMFCGKPVICTQLNNGVNEINPHNFTGITVPTKSAIGLAEAINQLSSDQEKCRLLGFQAKKHAQEFFSLSKSVNNHIDLYKKVYKST